MGVYTYQAKKGPGQSLEGQVEAGSIQEAAGKINSSGLYLISIKEKKDRLKRVPKVSLKELVEFTHQLSMLINSGSTLLSSLITLVSETEQTSLKSIIQGIISQVKKGISFSESLQQYPSVFPALYIPLVKVGETSGTLGENLKRIAEFLEEELEFRASISSVLTYPFIIVGVVIVTVIFLLKFFIPKLVSIFEEIGQTLPLPTLFLINISNMFSKYWFFFIGVIFLIFWGGRQYFKNPHNRFKWDRFKFRVPLLGEILKKIEMCRFSRAFSVLVRNNLPIDFSLKMVKGIVSNLFFQKELGKMVGQIEQGASLNAAMKKTGIFPPTFVNIVTVGEEAGTLGDVLETLSYDYNKEIQRRIKKMIDILEPVLIIGVGLVVVFVVLSMLLPVFEIDFNF